MPDPTLGERLLTAVTDVQFLLYLGLSLLGILVFFLARGRVRQWVRYGLLAASLAVLGFYFGGCPCPVGSATKLPTLFTSPALHLLPLFLFLVPTVIALFAGRIFCGWVCPLGAVQEFLGRLGLRKQSVPARVDRPLRFLKYGFLLALVAVGVLGIRFRWQDYDPFRAIFTFSGTWIAIGLAVFVGGLSLVVYRPWCRYACPLGAVLAVASRVGLGRSLVDAEACVGCKLCARACPMDAIRTKDRSARVTGEYIRCGDCGRVCRRNAIG
ncbi:MAG: 4Fe-4S binding protein [Candidatus Bipolaricaulota bacterium]